MVLVRALKKVMREQRVRSSTGTGTAPTAPAGDAPDAPSAEERRSRISFSNSDLAFGKHHLFVRALFFV